MTGASLVLCVVFGQSPVADPFALVSRLGAARFLEREQAAGALERLGRAALPALRAAREAKDPEVRTRAFALIGRIEGALLTQPSMVGLHFNETPLPDVLRAVSEQTGIKLTLVPENSPAWKTRRVTLDESAPVPFWKAVDRICDAARLQYNHGVHYSTVREPTFPLFDGNGRPPLPVSDSGPFRVSVIGLHFQRDFNFLGAQPVNRVAPGMPSPARAAPVFVEQCYVQVQVTGEPRLTLAQAGSLRITEAIDDRGQSLTAAPPPAGGTTQRFSGYFGYAQLPVIQLQAPLSKPAQAGSVIKRLKGVIPLTVATRKPNPLVVPLAGAIGRTFQNEDAAVTVHENRPPENNRPGSLEVSIRTPGGSGAVGGFGPPEMAMRPDAHQQQFEVLDSQGRIVPANQTGFEPESGRVTLTFWSHDPASKPAEFRYYGLIRAPAEVPFEFTELPLP